MRFFRFSRVKTVSSAVTVSSTVSPALQVLSRCRCVPASDVTSCSYTAPVACKNNIRREIELCARFLALQMVPAEIELDLESTNFFCLFSHLPCTWLTFTIDDCNNLQTISHTMRLRVYGFDKILVHCNQSSNALETNLLYRRSL